MGMFVNIVLFLLAVNIIFGVFGIIDPSESIIASMVTGEVTTTFMWDYIKGRLTGTDIYGLGVIFATIGSLAAGLITKRDELIYGPLMISMLIFLGIFNSFRIIPMFGNLLYVGMIILTTWTGIEWLRGKD